MLLRNVESQECQAALDVFLSPHAQSPPSCYTPCRHFDYQHKLPASQEAFLQALASFYQSQGAKSLSTTPVIDKQPVRSCQPQPRGRHPPTTHPHTCSRIALGRVLKLLLPSLQQLSSRPCDTTSASTGACTAAVHGHPLLNYPVGSFPAASPPSPGPATRSPVLQVDLYAVLRAVAAAGGYEEVTATK